ncbi:MULTISPECIES: lysylphosphatidylglycerol synthase transmembrane domain-containing protein [unclassified Lentimicrobium]|uniref:lysylphosphatidylglycerol synthase transmembrane domain-containing protein n=1 Tax=unclassified Lentimicrobium TaxID=2677434 RepID=UPI001557EB7E|nr:flippase-like domain-containing protein [Lentimicrobium sp. S6]NPD83146.1 flippase-like domain-containing protein [Lentimicrobium sp. L6]
MKISTKIRKSFNLFFKILLVSLVYIFLFFELSKHQEQFSINGVLNASKKDSLLLLLAFGLMPLNWLIESIKWRFLMRKIENVKLSNSIQAVFAGTAISIFTPNRIGDYLGRIFILKKGDRLDGTVATITGNLSQLLITILMGSVALIYFSETIVTDFLQWNNIWIAISIILILSIDIILLIIFFKFPSIENRLNRTFGIYRYPIIKHLNILAEYRMDELVKVLSYSLLRYLIYSVQFYLLLLAFHFDLSIIDGMMVVFLVFFGITIIPSIAVAELGVRALITLFVFQLIGQYSQAEFELGLIAATSILWLINIAFAAVIGGAFIFNLKFIRKKDLIEETDKNPEE